MIGVQLLPVDTWFFRDGTPFTADSAPQDNVGSLFPPHPPTVAGALRGALALGRGWNGRGCWPEGLNTVLGDGPEDFGALSMEGPFLLRENEPLFPAPRHLLGSVERDRWIPRVLLRPGACVTCDLGNAVRLPEAGSTTAKIEECKTGDGWWLTLAGIGRVLRGELPGEVVSSRCLWSEEPRVGLKRDLSKRAAEEGMLYSTRHVRLNRGVSIGLRLGGVPPDWTLPTDQLMRLGGENRLAVCQEWNAEPTLHMPLTEIEDSGQVTVIALTPLDLDEAVYRGRQPLDAPGNIRVVSACLTRPQRIGGWDSLTRRPLPLRPVLPPGSVLFCEIDDPGLLVDTMHVGNNNQLPRLGARQAWGFGRVALGVWP